jgi:hypothetical protein
MNVIKPQNKTAYVAKAKEQDKNKVTAKIQRGGDLRSAKSGGPKANGSL